MRSSGSTEPMPVVPSVATTVPILPVSSSDSRTVRSMRPLSSVGMEMKGRPRTPLMRL